MRTASVVAALALFCAPAHGEGGTAGDFDYYVLALTWMPSFCAGEGRGRETCADVAGEGFGLHGLWPQYEDGWPSFCPSAARPPSRGETAGRADLFGSGGAAWHQWRKHGTCSGLSAREYYDAAAEALSRVRRPAELRGLDRAVRLPASVVEQAFLEADPRLEPDGVTVTCRDGRIAEVRLCLDRSLEPRACTGRTRRDCTRDDALLPPVER